MNGRRVLIGALAGTATAPVFAVTLNPGLALLGSVVAGSVVGVLVEDRYDSHLLEGALAGIAIGPPALVVGLGRLWGTVTRSPFGGDLRFVVGVLAFSVVLLVVPATGLVGLASASVSRTVARRVRRRRASPQRPSRNP